MDTLTKREKEVALLVAEGLSNREIAERLCIAVKTVENHLTVIYGKLAVRSRAQLIIMLTLGRAESKRPQRNHKHGGFPP